jgi:hypothetical protein
MPKPAIRIILPPQYTYVHTDPPLSSSSSSGATTASTASSSSSNSSRCSSRSSTTSASPTSPSSFLTSKDPSHRPLSITIRSRPKASLSPATAREDTRWEDHSSRAVPARHGTMRFWDDDQNPHRRASAGECDAYQHHSVDIHAYRYSQSPPPAAHVYPHTRRPSRGYRSHPADPSTENPLRGYYAYGAGAVVSSPASSVASSSARGPHWSPVAEGEDFPARRHSAPSSKAAGVGRERRRVRFV